MEIFLLECFLIGIILLENNQIYGIIGLLIGKLIF